MYMGLLEYHEMAFLLHFLRAGDHFVDIGAFIGSYTVLASAVCGARTTAFEPAPASFERLCDNIRANQVEGLVTAVQAGVGREDALLPFTTAQGTKNRSIRNERLPEDAVHVRVRRLDDVITSDFPIALKIDAEGMEHEILEGATVVLSHPNLRCVIIELWHDRQLFEKLAAFGFGLYAYDPVAREIRAIGLSLSGDSAICLRDTDFIKQRISAAPAFSLFGELV
jgi:FkbM family methyltransferase